MTNAQRAYASFENAFAVAPDILVRAPGRVNLIGEHTDYNDGFVLPCAIDRDTVVAAGRTNDGLLHTVAADFHHREDIWPLSAQFSRAGCDWADYARAVAAMMAEISAAPSGARLAIAGDVPLGAGLSSSASLEVAIGHALARLAGVSIDPTRLAQTMQAAENRHVGMNCGIMDQLIAARGVADHALLIDCRSLDCRPVKISSDVAILVVHSGVRHAHAGGEYNDRRRECDRAAHHYGVEALRDLDLAALERGNNGLDLVAYRRARHIVTENARTQSAASALESGDLTAIGGLMRESHVSMREDFEITVAAVDELADIMNFELDGEGGARMTGGGFGGCVVALTNKANIGRLVAAVERNYRPPDGEPNDIFICRAADGAAEITG